MNAPVPSPMGNDPGPAMKKFFVAQFVLLGALIGLSLCNELVDLPHRLFGAAPTSFQQRWTEVLVEGVFYCAVIGIEIMLVRDLRRRLHILHGVLAACSFCGRIFHAGRWQSLEQYITEHSEASFTHTRCPECREAQQEMEHGQLRIVSGL